MSNNIKISTLKYIPNEKIQDSLGIITHYEHNKKWDDSILNNLKTKANTIGAVAVVDVHIEYNFKDGLHSSFIYGTAVTLV